MKLTSIVDQGPDSQNLYKIDIAPVRLSWQKTGTVCKVKRKFVGS